MVTLQLRQIIVPPGHRVLFNDVNWQEFEAILEELGEHRGSRIAYSQGTLEIRMPLPEHEKAREHPDFASIQKYDMMYCFFGKPTLS
ncbi:Uma2 family endonuclease, partial [Microcoleus sp. B4-C5]